MFAHEPRDACPFAPDHERDPPVGARLIEDRPVRALVEADRREAGVMEPVERARQVRDPGMGEMQQGARAIAAEDAE